jgi:hypothetical protein
VSKKLDYERRVTTQRKPLEPYDMLRSFVVMVLFVFVAGLLISMAFGILWAYSMRDF